jgi:hypothetical protein
VDDFPGVDDIMCPLSLMRLIEQTHQAPNTGAPIQDVTTAKNLYSDVKQGGRESLLDFFNRTKAALKMMEQLEIPDLPDNEVALNFISRLDKARFIELQTNIENQITPYPNDLQAAYQRAVNFKVVKLTAAGATTTASMFATQAFPTQGRGRGPQRRAGGGACRGVVWRIGLAGCDPLGLTVTPLPALLRGPFDRDLTHLLALVQQRRVQALVLGLPWQRVGQAGVITVV